MDIHVYNLDRRMMRGINLTKITVGEEAWCDEAPDVQDDAQP